LMECVHCLPSLNEKFAISACAALRALDKVSLSQMYDRGATAVGKTVVSCCVCLFDGEMEPRVTQKVLNEAELLLAHLLDCTSISDARYIIQSEELSRDDTLDQIYHWMVEKNIPADAFACFALAIQSSGINVDIQVEQHFSNRATCLVAHSENDDEL